MLSTSAFGIYLQISSYPTQSHPIIANFKISTDPGLLKIRHSHPFVAVVIQILIPFDDYDNRITVHFILLFICLTTVFEHSSYVYKFVLPEDDARTWYEAEALCKTRENGHLTSLVTINEIIWADSVIKNIVRDPRSKVKLWIGGSDRRISDAWDFVDAQPLRYNVAPWAPGQPRRPLQQAPYEFCVYLEFEGDRSRWYVEDCFKAHGYICKSEGRLSTI